MKNSMANVDARRDKLLFKIKQNGLTNVKDLAKDFSVSLVTLRRDLKILQKMGQVEWRYGRVKYVKQPIRNNIIDEKISISRIKDRITQAVPNYIKENSTLFVNSSSLCWRMVNQLALKPLTIITNNIRVSECARHPDTSIIMTGGEVLFPKQSLVGTVAVKFLETIQSDYTLIGCDGISIEEGLTTHNFYESQINNTMVQRTKLKVICIVDYRKIGVSSNYQIAKLKQIDVLITDNLANEKIIRQIRNYGVEVIQVPI